MPIDNNDIDRLKEIFMTRKECDENTDHFNKKLGKDDIRLAVIEQQNKMILWVLTAVGGGVITMLIKMFFGS